MTNVPTSVQVLSDITVHMKYARYMPELQRRETWDELVDRNMNMHIEKYPELEEQIREVYENYVRTKKVLPSMRSMQFAGPAIDANPSRIYNCAFMPMDSWEAFHEAMFLLLGGTGVGFSVQKHHVEQLPEIKQRNENYRRRYQVEDSIEGWADAIRALVKSYFFGGPAYRFDYRKIRAKGERLVTAGGKAPGPEPLKTCMFELEKMFERKKPGEKLTTIEVHDMVCHIADAVLAGGIRRAALISLFSANDEEMAGAKALDILDLHPQRHRANNSAVILRHKITKEVFDNLFDKMKASGTGEPGIYFTNDKDWGTNPCVEIALRPNQFCNLTEINASTIESQEDLNNRASAAAFIGTLQAGYTDFHYLRPIWQRNTEKDALIGVSMTGIASMTVFKYDLTEAAEKVRETNAQTAAIIGINPAARQTCVKPSGTTSLTLGTSSGIHAWHSEYYIRRIRVGKNEAIYSYLAQYHPELVEDEKFRPHDTAVIGVPQKAPRGAVTRSEGAIALLERVKQVSNEWIKPGFVDGQNGHNVSTTVDISPNRKYIKGKINHGMLVHNPEDHRGANLMDEWEAVKEWMWENRNSYNGLAVLPESGGGYAQLPFEPITKKEYEEFESKIHNIDLTQVIELDDATNLSGELACAGGSCEVV